MDIQTALEDGRYNQNLAQGTAPVKVYAIRGPQTEAEGGVDVPAIIWVAQTGQRVAQLGGISDEFQEIYEIECRADTSSEAKQLADWVRLDLGGSLMTLLADYAAPDNADQKLGKYFAHVLEIGVQP